MSLELFTIHHKDDSQLEIFRRHFIPMQVGCSLTSLDLGIRRDDTYGTLSARNRNYCELTAFDEIARSSSVSQIGIMHYRRVFVAPKPLRLIFQNAEYRLRVLKCRLGFKAAPVERHIRIRIRTAIELEDEARKLKHYLESHGKNFDIITPLAVKYHGQTLRAQYARAHLVEHFDLFMDALGNLHPKLVPFIAEQDDPPVYYLFNMFIMRRDIFERYWAMLSSTLFEIEGKIDLDALDAHQGRVFGFLAERFMAIFVRYMSATEAVRCGKLPVAQCDPEA